MAVQRTVVLGVLILIGLTVDWAALPVPQDVPWPLELPFLLGLLLLVSHVTGNLAADFGLPRITGYIIAGLLIGPSGFELVTDADVASLTLIDQEYPSDLPATYTLERRELNASTLKLQLCTRVDHKTADLFT